MEVGLKGRKVAILAADGVEQAQLLEPKQALEAAGAQTEVIAPNEGTIQSLRDAADGDRVPVSRPVSNASAAAYDAALLPGGARSATALRGEGRAIQFIREMMLADKPVAAIGEGTLLLIQADAIAGRSVAAEPALRAEIEAAGGESVDEPVHVDDRLVTGRKSSDLAFFTKRLVREFGNRIEDAKVDQLSESSFPASDPPPGPTAVGGEGASTTTPPR
jgi:protease I